MRARLPRLAVPVLLAAFLLAPSRADAACNFLSFCSCTATATGVSFGNYNPVSGDSNESTGSVRVVCTLVAAISGSFTIDLSTGVSGSHAQRTLQNGSWNLAYDLFTTAGHGETWGDGTGGTSNVTHAFTSLLQVDETFTIYGRIPAGQNVAAGPYSDTITITVTY